MTARTERAVQHVADALVGLVWFADRIRHQHHTH